MSLLVVGQPGFKKIIEALHPRYETRGLLQAIRADNGEEFCGHAILLCAHTHTWTLTVVST